MLVRNVHIRRWDVVFIFSFGTNDMERILDALFWADAPDSIIRKVSENVSAGYLNEGFTFSEPTLRKSVAAIGKTSSGPEFLNSTAHEITHVAQHISLEDGIDIASEDFAYLVGDLTSEVSDIVCELSCPHCRHD